MRSSNNVQLLLITQVLLFVKEVGFHHTHLGCCGIPEKRNSDSNTCKEHTNLYNYHTECCRTEEVSQSLVCSMSSEDQAILAGDHQHGGSNAGEDEEVVSKYFAKTENVTSNVNIVDLATDTVNSHVNIVDPATETVNSHGNIVDLATETVNSSVGTVDLATETVNSNVGTMDIATETVNSHILIVDPTVEKVSSHLDTVDLATDTVNSYVDTMGRTAEKLNSNADTVDPAAEKVNSDADTVDPASEQVNSNADTVDPASEQVNSNVDTIDPAAEKVNSNVDTVDPAAEKVNSNVDTVAPTAEKVNSIADTVDPASEQVNSNVDTVDPAAKKVNSNVDTVDPAAEKVNSIADTVDPASEQVNSNVDAVDPGVETKDAPAHVDHMENICEEGHKEMDTELNDRLPKTPENFELEDMIVQTNSNEVLQTPETVDMEENTSCDIDQSSDKVEATLNTENAEISEEEQIQYTKDDFRSPESECDMERDTDEEMNAIPENVEDDDLSASNTNSEQWTVVTGRSKKKRERKDDKIKENVEDDDLSASSANSEQLTSRNNKKRERKEDKIKDERHKLVKRFSDRDTENYRNGYPGKEDEEDLNDNVRFYMGEIASSPDGALIDDIHKGWKRNYKLLERHHGYIQWLFPIRESGMNWQAQPLQLHEAEAIKADPKAKKRVLESYKLMLDFYGMQLVDEETGKLKRSKNWKPRFENLKWSSHNYLRITRILKCLGELGYEHLKKGFIQFVLKEALEHRTLEQTLSSCQDYWIGTIKNDQDREELYDYIDQFGYKHFGVGAPDPVLENSSGYSGTLWACTKLCMRLVFQLAYIPISVFWWLFAMIFGTFGKKKQC